MKKVKLPRDVAEALNVLKTHVHNAGILWLITSNILPETISVKDEILTVRHYANVEDNIFRIADAIRYGYEIEDEPITVTITPEMQYELRKVYNDCPFDEKVGFRSALTVLDLKITGVNA